MIISFTVQGKIEETQNKLKETDVELVTLKGQFAIKLQQLSEEELDLKWIKNKKKIMEEQAKELKEKVEKQSLLLKEKTKEADDEREAFMGRVSSFICNFGLCGNGKRIRDAEANQKLEELRKSEMDLLTELKELRRKQEEVDDLQLEKTTLMEEIKTYKDRVAELEQKIDSEKTKTKGISDEKQCLAKRPETGQEFQRLQQELDTCRRDSLEGLCQALQPEVDRLQRQAWQRQIQIPHRPTVSSSSSIPVTLRGRLPPLSVHQGTRALSSSKRHFTTARSLMSEMQPSGQWKSKQVGGTSWETSKMIIPPEPPLLEDSPPKADGSKTIENETVVKLSDSNMASKEEQQPVFTIEEVLISDDEDLFEDDILESPGKPSDSSRRFPQKAKRVRFM
ncbi:hypothetical protein HOLleu_33437 [Holothuria leucospilota]|uniref:Coiled-coil domain-containing protein 172 n=1 Tax=Holothuria leucospilota TaxID=206669 RepID=A0A9Q1BI22_HOLLE|nr:hypothetical protein HOLleu_33437 [Holothuria leucospilota]